MIHLVLDGSHHDVINAGIRDELVVGGHVDRQVFRSDRAPLAIETLNGATVLLHRTGDALLDRIGQAHDLLNRLVVRGFAAVQERADAAGIACRGVLGHCLHHLLRHVVLQHHVLL